MDKKSSINIIILSFYHFTNNHGSVQSIVFGKNSFYKHLFIFSFILLELRTISQVSTLSIAFQALETAFPWNIGAYKVK